MSTDTLLYAGSVLTLGVDGFRTVGSIATDGCCGSSLDQSYETLACSFVGLLPAGPMWDTQKSIVIQNLMVGEEPPADQVCHSMVSYALYAAQNLHHMTSEILRPMLAESDALTAYETVDDWLERYGWQDCYLEACDTGALTKFSPYRINMSSDLSCGEGFCDFTFDPDFELALKHNILRSIARARNGVIKNLSGINWVIEPLGAELKPREPLNPEVQDYLDGTEECDRVGPPCFCGELEFQLVSISSVLNTPKNWPQNAPVTTLQVLTCNTTGVEITTFPGIAAAECIVKSLLGRKCPNIIFRSDGYPLPLALQDEDDGSVLVDTETGFVIALTN